MRPVSGDRQRRLRLAIVSGIVDASHGGPAMVLRQHVRALSRRMDVTVYGVVEAWQRQSVAEALPGSRLFPAVWPRRWFRGAGLARALAADLAGVDVIHAHMLWDHPVWAAGRLAERAGKPFIITPHGSLMEPWRYRSWPKRIYRRALGDAMLARTRFLHVLSDREAEGCRRAGVATPCRVIPNGLEAEAFAATRARERGLGRWPQLAGRRVLLYLGRLWRDKGVGDLVRAWAAADRAPWTLVLAGPDYRGYRSGLLAQVAELGLQDRVLLTGEVGGLDKADLWALASAFVLPSRGEGFSMALLEAMAAGVPALYTRACFFPQLARAGGGLEVPAGEAGLAGGLDALLALDDAARAGMGARGRALAREKFTMDRVAEALMEMYREALDMGRVRQ